MFFAAFCLLYFVFLPRIFSEKPSGLPIAGKLSVSSEDRRLLMRAYALFHYGIDDWKLTEPSMLVIHYTGNDSDRYSLEVFAPARLSSSRADIERGGEVNVGVHYVILRDGSIWSVLDETEMGRHVIGYNHRALGIEMTGSSGERITDAQIASCAALVADILRRHPGIRYLIGHHEYMEAGRPHRSEYTALHPEYAPTIKHDPGEAVMARIRALVEEEYGITP